MKLAVILLFYLCAEKVLLPFAGVLIGWMGEDTQVIVVMAVFPLIMNVLQVSSTRGVGMPSAAILIVVSSCPIQVLPSRPAHQGRRSSERRWSLGDGDRAAQRQRFVRSRRSASRRGPPIHPLPPPTKRRRRSEPLGSPLIPFVFSASSITHLGIPPRIPLFITQEPESGTQRRPRHPLDASRDRDGFLG